MAKKNTFSASRIARLALMAALVAVGAQITIPMPAIPFTLQTFFIVMTGALLGPMDAFFAMCAYLLLGAVGVPVFAGFSAGVAKFVGVTGGYLFSYPFVAAICGCFYKKKELLPSVLMAVVGILVCELSGTAFYKFVSGVEWGAAFLWGFGVFVVKDIILAIIAVSIAHTIRPRIKALH